MAIQRSTFQHTTIDKPSHDAGTQRGEERSKPIIERGTRKADDATTVNAAGRAPIDPRMPHLPPA